MTTTTRLALDIPQSTENISSYPAEAAQSLGVLDNAVIVTEGTLASRPSSTQYGNEYFATDTNQYFKYNGSAWTGLLQMLSSANASKVTFGSSNVTFTSGNAETTSYSVAHGLGKVPVFMTGWLAPNGSSASAFILQNFETPDATNLYFYGWASSAVGSTITIPFYWLAIG